MGVSSREGAGGAALPMCAGGAEPGIPAPLRGRGRRTDAARECRFPAGAIATTGAPEA